MARAAGVRRDVYNRVAGFPDAVYLDLGTHDSQVLSITKDGWTVCNPPDDVRFIRPKGLSPLPIPQHGRPLRETLPEFLRIDIKSDGYKLLVAWLVAALRGLKPFPILAMDGEPGATQSAACTFLRRLLDPSFVNLGALPKDERDLMIAARASYIQGFDNLSWINDSMADSLCRLATGSGFRTRQLTTDTDEALFSTARPIVLNGINEVVRRSDMLDRTLVVGLEAVPDDERLTEAEVEAKFQAVASEVMGSLADAVAQAIREPRRPKRLPRMADFACVIESASPALGWGESEFLNLYERNRAMAARDTLRGDGLAAALESLSVLGATWEGTLKSLLEEVNRITVANNGDISKLPKSERGLSARLKRTAPLLRHLGVHYTPPPRNRVEGVRLAKLVFDQGEVAA